ncbi:DUF4331 family protein [Longimicrobium sp.]|uniref:DUF4331 family protein n=1 Tax=Longimicrobium sp. TaxID=2029185 RepID=UPI002C838450|nr:DUF4331 family protein [Longimicrobium sp.]HSU16917.1 DUF4331 family protein [Longimicrobium sp.]
MRMIHAALPAIAAAAIAAACTGDATRSIVEVQKPDTVTVHDTIRIGNTSVTFDQMERLGNPLVSEVFVEKREHGHFNASQPGEDVAQFRDDIARFITGVAGRDPAYANAVAAALTPDMLVVRTDKVGGGPYGPNVGWLTYVLDPANGYGGRKLQGDDVVDKGLAVIFGNALGNNNNVSPGLVTDNVDANDHAHGAAFPYLAPPN